MTKNLKKFIFILIFIIWVFLLVISIFISKEDKSKENTTQETSKTITELPEICENLDYKNDLLGRRTFGLYSDEGDYTWASKSSAVELQNSRIKEKGLEFKFQTVLSNLKKANKNVTPKVKIFINGVFIDEYDLYDNCHTYLVPKDRIPETDLNRYYIEFESNSSFKPSELEDNEDSRELSFQILYVGEQK